MKSMIEHLGYIVAALTIVNIAAFAYSWMSLWKSAGSSASDRFVLIAPILAVFSALIIFAVYFAAGPKWLKIACIAADGLLFLGYLFLAFLAVLMAGG
jgi:hypothetical protein